MSELIITSNRGKVFLWHLLGTASALVLTGAIGTASDAKAQENDFHAVWIELGGSLQRLDTSEEMYVPPFLLQTPRPGPETVDPLSVGHLPRSSFDAEGKITFKPEGSSWDFSAAVRFGRSKAHQNLHQKSNLNGPLVPATRATGAAVYQYVFQFIDAGKNSSESHAIIDFHVGKDVGLGMLGAGSSSVLNAGIRFAQFDTRSSTTFASDPDAHLFISYFVFFPGVTQAFVKNAFYHVNNASAAASRGFHGIGPSLSWNASAPVIGDAQNGEIVLDWGVNAALLVGRQRADVHHQRTAIYHHGKYASYNPPITSFPDPGTDKHRSRSVTVPNLGGFVGATYRIENFKVSAGYRADFFFGAMDGGVDARKTEDEKLYGPFAAISIGLGG